MPRLSTLFSSTFVVSLATVAIAQTPPDECARARTQKAAGPTAGTISPAEVCRVLSVLAHDSLEGRGTGTPGGARAARYIADEFRAARLEPAGDSGCFQRVPLVMSTRNGRVFPTAVPSFAARDTFPSERR